MKETKRNTVVRRVEAVCLILALLLTSFAPGTVEAATTSIQSVEEIDFSDFSNWRSGVYYYANGKYVEDSYRICLNDYVTFSSEKYKAHITDSAFRILIRELNSNKNFLRSVTLVNGQTYEPGESAVYLAISVYKFVNGEKDMSYEVFENKFSNGFVAELCEITDTSTENSGSQTVVPDTEDTEETDTEEEIDTEEENEWNTVENTDFTDFSNWRTGYYHYSTGKYASYSSRICLNDYVTFENDEYVVSINKSGYHLLIREMDENMKFIKSSNLTDGETYTPNTNAEYLGISVYKLSESGVTYTTFKNLFANGFEAKLVTKEEYEKNADIVETPSISQKATAYEVLEEMIKTADTSVKDISSYKVTFLNFYLNIYPKLQEELKIEFSAYRNLTIETDISGLYVTSCWLNGVDAGAKERVPCVRKNVEEFIANVDSAMSDVEKVLLVHEYLIRNTVYKFDDAGICYVAGGPLGNGAGVCGGYARAMMLLLEKLDIEAHYVSSSSMNHAWVYVQLDGAWYHIDPTWDDTRMGSNGMYVHRFLLRNDEEFHTTLTGNLHYGWEVGGVSASSTSTKYSDWYVHDVAGLMHYYNGMWYYWDIDTNSILCSNIAGTVTKVVVDGTDCDKIKLNGISGNVLSYYIGSTQYTRSL